MVVVRFLKNHVRCSNFFCKYEGVGNIRSQKIGSWERRYKGIGHVKRLSKNLKPFAQYGLPEFQMKGLSVLPNFQTKGEEV